MISYNLRSPCQLRHKRIEKEFKFDYTCDLCCLLAKGLHESDNRQIWMQLLDDTIGDADRLIASLGGALADCRELLQLYRSKAITDARVARVCYDAFQICVTHGDQARASVFARMAYETRLYVEGHDRPDTQKMKSFMADPANHMSYGFARRWNIPRRQSLNGLDAEGFSQWL